MPFWCTFVAFVVHCFLHLFSGQMWFIFSHFVCCFLHSKASFGDLFLRFLCSFFGVGFAFVALCMHVFCFAVSSELALAYIIKLIQGGWPLEDGLINLVG